MTTEMFTKTDAEYKAIDTLYAKTRKLFNTLKDMEAKGMYGSEKWSETFAKYAETFKKCHGYRPHWAR